MGHTMVGVLVGTLVMAGSVAAQELTGRQIVDEVAARHEAPYDFEKQAMTLIDKKGNQEIRDTRRYARKGADEQFKYLIVFDSPPGVKGVALLTWQHADTDDDQWLYLPAQGDQVKRIAKGSKKNYFMGTDFTYEDLVSESRDKFTYTRLPDELLEGAASYVVEVTPADANLAKDSGYQKRIAWVRKDNFYATKTDYYDKQGKLLKRQTSSGLEHVGGNMWRAKTTKMDNLSNGHATLVQVDRRALEDSGVPEEVFQQRFLTSGQHMR